MEFSDVTLIEGVGNEATHPSSTWGMWTTWWQVKATLSQLNSPIHQRTSRCRQQQSRGPPEI
ncbi:TMUB2 isoform 12 [Pongo abelii]|uniref:TMUB2 isoform 12 n=1 Tax=Pongo abelii TaxID=9601 RepID=A0A2J8UYD5_PONAB|nr:TMUB2 isoform 7 [Pongo abelii]PNJ50280.1 TMUB2 isoform 12 [Pongo abelii]